MVAPSEPRRVLPLAATVAAALLVAGCEPKKDTETPGGEDAVEDPERDGPLVDPRAAGLSEEAVGQGPDTAEMATEETRKREKPADPKTRDAALVAAAHGNPEGAATFLSEHLKSKPGDTEAAFALARAQRLLGRLDAAQETLEAARAQAKKSKDKAVEAQVLRRLAALREVHGDIAGAEKLIVDGLGLDPTNLLLQGERVRLALISGKVQERDIRGLIDGLYDAYGDGTAQTAEQILGASYAALAERAFKSTNRLMQEAENLAPASEGSELGDEIAVRYAELFLEKYKPSEAAQTVARVLERDPWNPEALALMARIALDDFRLGPASRAAEEALQVNPGNAEAHTVLAWVALIEGRRDEARERVTEHVLTLNPAHVDGQAVMAALAIYERDEAAYKKARDAVFAARPVEGQFYSGLGDLLGYLHLYPEADEVLTEGAKRLPDDPYVQGALGLSRLRLGDEVAGRAALDFAWRKDKYNARTLNVRQLYRESIEPNYAEQKSGGLTVRLPAELQEVVGPGFIDAIASAQTTLDKAYGIDLSTLRVEIFADPEDFSIRTVGTPNLGALGVCFGPVITALGPYAGTHNFDHVIWHEIAHSYAIELSEGRVPRWFTEGLSEWESELAYPPAARESAALLSAARDHDALRKLSELELAFLRAENAMMMEVAYATASWAMRYLGETYGRPKIVVMLKGYAKGKSTEELFVEVLGKDMATVEKEFEAWFDAELDRKISGWRPNLQDPKAQDDPRVQTLMEVMKAGQEGDFESARKGLEALVQGKGDGAQTRLMLGNVLEQLGDDKAAAKQYEKAASFSIEALEPLMALAALARKQGDVKGELDVLERVLAIDGMSLEPALRALVLAVASGDKRAEAFSDRASAIAPLHPTALAGASVVAFDAKGKKRAQVLLDESMVTALRPDAGLDVVVSAAVAADRLDDPRVKDLAPRALESKELPKAARKRLEARLP